MNLNDNSNIHNKRGLIQKTNYIKIKNNSQQTIDGRIHKYNKLWVYLESKCYLRLSPRILE